MFWDGKEGPACLTQRPGESWALVLAVLPPGEALGQAASPWGLSLSACILKGFLLSTCCVLGTGAACEQDRQFLPQELTFWWEKQSDSHRHSLRHWGFSSEPSPCLYGAFILVRETGRQTNVKTAEQRWKRP